MRGRRVDGGSDDAKERVLTKAMKRWEVRRGRMLRRRDGEVRGRSVRWTVIWKSCDEIWGIGTEGCADLS